MRNSLQPSAFSVQPVSRLSSWAVSLSVLTMLIAACVPQIPATTPPQLQHTPGAFVVVDEHVYDAGVFRVAYPSGWRIVKSNPSTELSPEVVFVSPDDALEIYLSVGLCAIPESTPEAGMVYIYDTANSVCLYGRAPIEREAEFSQIFEQVRDSVR